MLIYGQSEFYEKSINMEFKHVHIFVTNRDVGGETGANARPMDAAWVQNIQKQCEAAKVPFFFKQWGEFIDEKQITNPEKQMHGQTYSRWSNGDLTFYKCGNQRAGHLLEGKEYREYPDAK